MADLVPRLYRFAVSLTQDEDLARDLVQATCLRALERKDQFQEGTRLDHWTFAILASLRLNAARADRVRRGNGYVDLETLIVPDPSASVERNLLIRQVMAIVDKLDEHLREAVVLVYVEGFSYEEASLILKCPAGTVASRLVAARQLIVRHLKLPDQNEGDAA